MKSKICLKAYKHVTLPEYDDLFIKKVQLMTDGSFTVILTDFYTISDKCHALFYDRNGNLLKDYHVREKLRYLNAYIRGNEHWVFEKDEYEGCWKHLLSEPGGNDSRHYFGNCVHSIFYLDEDSFFVRRYDWCPIDDHHGDIVDQDGKTKIVLTDDFDECCGAPYADSSGNIWYASHAFGSLEKFDGKTKETYLFDTESEHVTLNGFCVLPNGDVIADYALWKFNRETNRLERNSGLVFCDTDGEPIEAEGTLLFDPFKDFSYLGNVMIAVNEKGVYFYNLSKQDALNYAHQSE